MEKSSGCHNAVIEFDTEESAAEWHNEVSTALFAYRQRRAGAAKGESPRESSGVRICVPLHRIEGRVVQEFPGVGLIVTVKINDDPDALNIASAPSLSETYSGDISPPKASGGRELRLLIFKQERSIEVPNIITRAKERSQRHIDEPPLEADVVTVDFGPYVSVCLENAQMYSNLTGVAD